MNWLKGNKYQPLPSEDILGARCNQSLARAGFFSGAIEKSLSQDKSHPKDTGVRAIFAAIRSKLGERMVNADNTVRTGFQGIEVIGLNKYIVHSDTPEKIFKKVDIRSADEVKLHILIQSQLRENLAHHDPKNFDSISKEIISSFAQENNLKKDTRPVPASIDPKTTLGKRQISPASEPQLSIKRNHFNFPFSRQKSVPELVRKPSFGFSTDHFAGQRITPLRTVQSADGNFLFHDADKENGHFSNFWTGKPIEIDGSQYKSVEHYFQAQKFSDSPLLSSKVRAQRARIRTRIEAADAPSNTKTIAWKSTEAGACMIPPSEWDTLRREVMYKGIYAKFSQDPVLRATLLATGAKTLVENMPTGRSDRYWGMLNGEGENQLGQILVEVRTRLREESHPTCSDDTHSKRRN